MALAPGAIPEYSPMLARVEGLIARLPEGSSARAGHALLNTLGTLLFRAGRDRDAVERIGEGIAADGNDNVPQDLAILALARHRLGQDVEAREALDRLNKVKLRFDNSSFWEDQEIDLLRKEAAPVLQPH